MATLFRSSLGSSSLPCLVPQSLLARTKPSVCLRLVSTSPRRYSSNMAPPPRLTYSVAASFTGKDRPYNPQQHLFQFNPYHRIQTTKRPRRMRPDSGHDAFFVSRVGDSGSIALGVADGVGGWVESGVDPADFSHNFCDYMAAAAFEDTNTAHGMPMRARTLMQLGYDAVCNDRTIHAGGSTACVAIAAPDGSLDVANLGDSGYILLRLNGVHSFSEPQTHAFNTPFQLSVVPPSVAARMAAFGGSQLSDLPRDADTTLQTLRHGDVLILASDGVWDNLFNQDILHIASRVMTSAGAWVMSETGGINVRKNLRPLTNPEEHQSAEESGRQKPLVTLQSALASQLTAAAKVASLDTKTDGPFAKAVHKSFPGENWRGGKVDDICVVAVVVSEDTLPAAKL